MDGVTEGWRWGRHGRRALAGLVVGAVGTLGLASGGAASIAAPAVEPPATPTGAAHAAETASNWLGGHDEFGGGIRSLWLGDVARSIRSDRLPSSADGRGVDVALVDTGVSPEPGLDSPDAVADGPDLSLDHQIGAPTGVDGFGHGTHLAGIIAGRSGKNPGIADGARLLNVKAGAADGSVDVSQVIAAIDWVTQHRNDPGMSVRVLNLSFGTESVQGYQLDPLAHAVESAWRNGIVVVVAAGNSGGALTDPAIDPYVLTVGAADIGDPSTTSDDRVADFSSVGDANRRVDLVAPGVSIISSAASESLATVEHPEALVDGGYIKGSGTSQAAAVVSGAVADLISAHPELTPDQVKGLLTVTATRLGNSPAASQGSGLLNVELAERVAGFAWLLPRQSFPASTGLGSIELARGGNHLMAPDGSDLAGEVDVLGNAWVPTVWAPLSSAGAAWNGGIWNGGELTGIGWATLTGEDGAPFTGSTWRGSTWRSDAWAGSTWRGSTWRGSTWRGSTWRGSTWRGSTWRGSDTLEERLTDLAAMVQDVDDLADDGITPGDVAAAQAAIRALAAQADAITQGVAIAEAAGA
jgi:serine protease AprX